MLMGRDGDGSWVGRGKDDAIGGGGGGVLG
jgi:hypothetical protein